MENTSPFKVVSTVPIPTGAVPIKYPFDQMKVGDSFDIGDTDPKAIASAIRRFTKSTGWKFTVRYPQGTISKTKRCWRIE